MLFNSFAFLVFFPAVTLLYFVLPHRWRWLHLLAASCFFYMYFIPVYILILLVTIVIDYSAGLLIHQSTGRKKSLFLLISIISTCLVLFVFKYFNFFNANFEAIASFFGLDYPVKLVNIILPVGLSFHTFQSLSYVVEVYRGKQLPERHFGYYSLYVMFYPQLVAGPIERPQNLLHQLREKHSFEYARAVSGLKLILWGMFKKVVVADRLAVYVNAVYNNQAEHSGASLALATVFFAFQIYCDFSGYSDIAIGSARVMGIDLMTNFRWPYLSRSIAEFWKRWHISLSTWFRDYVYIPLGGNRVSNARLYFNLMITFLISGLWHGANWTFVAWGGINGAYLVSGIWINKLLSKTLVSLKTLQGIAGIAVCFVLVCLTWVYFRASSIGEAHEILGKIFTSHNSLFTGPVSGFIYSLAGLSVVILHDITEEYRIESLRFFSHGSSWVRRTAYAATVMAIMLFGVFDGGQFIYFQF